MLKNLSDVHNFNCIIILLSQKTYYYGHHEDIDLLFGASFFDFVFATSDYAKNS